MIVAGDLKSQDVKDDGTFIKYRSPSLSISCWIGKRRDEDVDEEKAEAVVEYDMKKLPDHACK